jgi:ABC-type multidrug transport system fused ATPase/permease subunit
VKLAPVLQKLYADFAVVRADKPNLDALYAAFMREMPATQLPAETAETLPLRRALELEDVRYTFPESERPALAGLDLRIEANTTVGIVGPTGAGKTTAIDVILGLLQPQSGVMRVDGTPIGPDNVRAWQRSVGYVPQTFFHIDDTVAANIGFGVDRAEIDHAAVERAARIANLHEFVMALPQGYDTLIGERGSRLSGGQAQRLAIARALYRDPDVLVFDEATSALDNLTEKAVMEAVQALGRQKTVILVAHRLSTVRRCDNIFFLDGGRVGDVGRYEDLVTANERFRALHEATA